MAVTKVGIFAPLVVLRDSSVIPSLSTGNCNRFRKARETMNLSFSTYFMFSFIDDSKLLFKP